MSVRMSDDSEGTVFQCEECEKTFSRKKNLIIHRDEHFATKNSKCNVCKRSFKTNDKLIKHMEIHADKKPHKCEICKKRYAYKIDKVRHMMTHENEVLLKCNVCDVKCTGMSALIKHKKRHAGEELYECEICYNFFTKADNHKCHENYPEDCQIYKCKSCHRQFTDLIECLKHMKGHKDKSLPMCKICGQRFANYLSLRSHVKFHDRKKTYKCKVCGEQFAIYTVFISHKRSHIKGNKCFDCVFCCKKFVKKYELRNHMLQHVDEKPFKCNVCKKLFSRKDALRRHMRHLHLEIKGGVLKFKPHHKRRTAYGQRSFKHKVNKLELSHENITVKDKCNENNQMVSQDYIRTRSKTGSSKKKLTSNPASNLSSLFSDDEVCDFDFEGFQQDIAFADTKHDSIKAPFSDAGIHGNVTAKCNQQSDLEFCNDEGESSNEEGESSNNHHRASSCGSSGSSWYENVGIGKPVSLKQSKCTVCGKFFTSEIVRTYHHMRQHMGEECNQCMYCGQVFYNCSDFRSHQISSHSIEG